MNGANRKNCKPIGISCIEFDREGTTVTLFSLCIPLKHLVQILDLDDLKLEVQEKGTTAWEEVTIPNYSTGADNKFVASGDIDLSKFAGKTIQFAFHYKSS